MRGEAAGYVPTDLRRTLENRKRLALTDNLKYRAWRRIALTVASYIVLKTRRSIKSTAVRAAAARAAMLPLTAVCAILATRQLIDKLGLANYSAIAVAIAIPQLLPFLDFGLGAAITNCAGAARRGGAIDRYALSQIFRRTFRYLSFIAACCILLAIGLQFSGLWWPILGHTIASNELALAASIVVGAIGLGIPLGIGTRLLIGHGMSATVVTISSFQSLIFLLLISTLQSSADVALTAVLFSVSMLAPSAISFALAMRITRVLTPPAPLESHDRAVGNILLRRTAIPMLIVSIMIPVSFQGGRLELAHLIDVNSLALYSVSLQIVLALSSVSAAAGNAFWGMFAGSSGSEMARTWLNGIVTSLLLAMGLCGLWLAGAPAVIRLASGNRLNITTGLWLWFCAFLFIHTVHQVSGMLLTTERELLTQAKVATVSALITLLTTVVLASIYGPSAGAFGLVSGYCCLAALCFARAYRICRRFIGSGR